MPAKTTGSADRHRSAAADLDLIVQARDAAAAAEEHLDGVIREVRTRRQVTIGEMATALGIGERGVYKRLATPPDHPRQPSHLAQ